jgi:hypothetical protein
MWAVFKIRFTSVLVLLSCYQALVLTKSLATIVEQHLVVVEQQWSLKSHCRRSATTEQHLAAAPRPIRRIPIRVHIGRELLKTPIRRLTRRFRHPFRQQSLE